jgi:lipocalin
MKTFVVRYHTDRKDESCKRVALVQESRKYLWVLALTPSSKGKLAVWKVDKTERKYMTFMTLGKNKRPYPLSRAVKAFRRMGKTHGINKRAKQFLKEATE